jgi:eukaryotic-like serine/threonine-protein kinase
MLSNYLAENVSPTGRWDVTSLSQLLTEQWLVLKSLFSSKVHHSMHERRDWGSTMAVPLPYSLETFRSTSNQLLPSVHKNALQDTLIASKLVRKDVQREELKKYCANPSAWLTFVFNKLASPSTQEAALRALSGMVEGSLVNLDSRIVNRMRKARSAAEQSQTERLRWEIDGLNELRRELGSSALPEVGPTLFLWCKAPHARDQIIVAAKAILSQESNIAVVSDPPSEAYSQMDSGKIFSSPSEVLHSIKTLLIPEFSPGPSWGLEEVISSIDQQAPKAAWPDPGTLAKITTELGSSIRKAALTSSPTQIAFKDLSRIKSWASSTRELVNRFRELEEQVDSIRQQVVHEMSRLARESVPPFRDSIERQADEASRGEAIERCIESVEETITQSAAAVRRTLSEVSGRCEEIISFSKHTPCSVPIDWDLIRNAAYGRDLETLDRQARYIREASDKEESRLAKVRAAFSMAERELPAFTTSLDSTSAEHLTGAVLAGDEQEVLSIIRDLRRGGHESVVLKDIKSAEGVPAGENPPRTPRDRALEQVIWKTPQSGFKVRSPYVTDYPSDPNLLLPFLLSQASTYLSQGSVTATVDCLLDILQLLAHAEKGAEPWLNRVVSLFSALAITPTLSGQSLGRATQLITEELETDQIPSLPPILRTLVQAPGFDDSIAQIFGYREFLPFAENIATMLHDVAVAESPYLLEDLARGVGKSCLYGFPQTAIEILIAIAGTEGLDGQIIASARSALDSAISQTLRPRAIINARIFGAPYWLQQGVAAFESAVILRGRGSERHVDDRAQKFINVQLPPVVQKSAGFPYSANSGTLDLVFMVTNPPEGVGIAPFVELVIPKSRNPWLEQDTSYTVGPLVPGDKALVPMTLDVNDPLPPRFEVDYDIRVRQAGFSQTVSDPKSLTITISEPQDIEIDEYPGALGLPIILADKALELSSPSVRKAFRELSRSLETGGVAAMVYGRRRRGKTSILRTISENRRVLERYVVQFDSKEDRPFRSLNEALRHIGSILDTVMTKAGVDIPPLSEALSVWPHWNAIQNWLETAKQKAERPINVLLLIDEFQKWLSGLDSESRSQLLSIIRGIYIRQGGNLKISIILSGLTNIYEYRKASADFSNAFHNVFEIQKFDQRSSEALIRSNSSIEFDRRAVELVRLLSGGNPYLINLLGNAICKLLREKERPYCFRDDVEEVVRGQLDEAKSSPIWLFLQYMLKQGEEDYASEIAELPALIDLAWTLGRRSTARDKVAVEEIGDELRRAGIPCDNHVLRDYIERLTAGELLVREGDRYRFESPWLGEWLTISNGGHPVPIAGKSDPNLVLNRYRIIASLPHKGQAEVWKAQDIQNIHGTVILKVYPSTWDGSSIIVQRESEHLSRIRHPAVVTCLNRGRDEHRGDVVVLQYVSGENLQDLMRSGSNHAARLIGPAGDLATQIEFIEHIVEGLAECHAMNVVHKDIKPANIMAQNSAGKWYPTIIDFGISSELEGDPIAPTTAPYTPEYTAPEKFLNQPRRAAADIYSLGLVTYELLTGTSPFSPAGPESLSKRLSGDFSPVKQLRPDVSIRLSELVGQMLATSPDDRPTADTLVGQLSRAREDRDWMTYRNEALTAEEPEEICEKALAAVNSATDSDRGGDDYIDLLDLLVGKAGLSRKTNEYARQLIQPLVRVALANANGSSTLANFLRSLIQEPTTDAVSRENKRISLRFLIDFLLDNAPAGSLVAGLHVLLDSQNDPSIWEMRHEVFLIAASYTSGELIESRCEGWCLKACKKARVVESNMLEAQLWLKRATRLSVNASGEFLLEKKEIDRILETQATRAFLPEIAKTQDKKIVGEDEKGHLNVEQIDRWGESLRRLYPFVHAVKRVRKENDKSGATRILNTVGMSLHLKAAPGVKESRIIPALLDRSFCGSADTMLRINIILSENCTSAQREAAIELLASDTKLFPGGRCES